MANDGVNEHEKRLRLDAADGWPSVRPSAEWAVAEIDRLRAELAELRAELARLRGADTRADSAEAVLRGYEAEHGRLRADLAAERRKITELVTDLDQAQYSVKMAAAAVRGCVRAHEKVAAEVRTLQAQRAAALAVAAEAVRGLQSADPPVPEWVARMRAALGHTEAAPPPQFPRCVECGHPALQHGDSRGRPTDGDQCHVRHDNETAERCGCLGYRHPDGP